MDRHKIRKFFRIPHIFFTAYHPEAPNHGTGNKDRIELLHRRTAPALPRQHGYGAQRPGLPHDPAPDLLICVRFRHSVQKHLKKFRHSVQKCLEKFRHSVQIDYICTRKQALATT